ncbi:MAG: 3-methyl-2-oxobutanoate hydroxymethyltransferase [Zoogloeaceae bacterium]|jgi:3-methyl-2-oxobutanoate hydroxymethyltransferase|nr:3-methyl-2-oxobutanoate hydroxymethyltransferase [Zoogloeaceae bacterium]
MSVHSSITRLTLTEIARLYREGEKIVMLTCYDASFAAVMDAAGVELLLVGDSLGNVVQGEDSTLPVTLQQMAYHTAAVKRGSQRAMIVSDLPFGASQLGPEDTFRNAARLMAAGAQMVKLEGGREMAATVEFLTRRGIPVCGHLGLTPQSVHQLGGFRVQGKDAASAERLVDDARSLGEAGASMIVLEAVPASLADRITGEISVPTIGIGAGAGTSGQVLVVYDMLDIGIGRKPRFVKNFMASAGSVQAAVAAYVREVKAGAFPAGEHTY